MPRYRMIIDLDDTKATLTTTQLTEIVDEVKHKVTLALNPEQKRNGLTLEVNDQSSTNRAWHHHVGNDCYGCFVLKDDSLGQ